MKLSLSFLVVLASWRIAPAVSIEFAVRALFNNGNVLPAGQTCSSSEFDTIHSTMLASRRRNLRTDRRLDPVWCKAACLGFPPGKCDLVYSGCPNTRRRDEEFTPVEEEEPSNEVGNPRELTATSCTERISQINTALDTLQPSMSTDCQAVLGAPRSFTCFEVNCQITSFALWNADADTVSVANFPNGGSFCKSAFKFAFEAVTESCVQSASFQITGQGYKSNRAESASPWMSFGKNGNGNDKSGKSLKAGNYTLTAYPDLDPARSKSLTFTVNNC
jgi:hypothetical protein